VPPRPTAAGGAGHILGAAYSTRSNVPVLRVPLTPHALPSMTAHRLSAEGPLPPTSLSAPTTEHSPQQQQQQPASAGTSPTPAWRPAGAAGEAPAGEGGRLRAASMSAGSAAATATPGGAGASAADRRKSLLAPISPQQMKAALRDDEFSYFAEEDKGVCRACRRVRVCRVACVVHVYVLLTFSWESTSAAAARKLTTTTTQAAPKAGSTSPAGAPTKQPQPQQPQQQPRLTHEQARTMRMASLAAAREGRCVPKLARDLYCQRRNPDTLTYCTRPQRAQRPVRGLAPMPNAAQAAVARRTLLVLWWNACVCHASCRVSCCLSFSVACVVVCRGAAAKEWKGASRQGTGTLRLNLAALRSQSFRDPSGFATLKRRAPTFLASPGYSFPSHAHAHTHTTARTHDRTRSHTTDDILYTDASDLRRRNPTPRRS
jgi:hypothetical protein